MGRAATRSARTAPGRGRAMRHSYRPVPRNPMQHAVMRYPYGLEIPAMHLHRACTPMPVGYPRTGKQLNRLPAAAQFLQNLHVLVLQGNADAGHPAQS